MTSSSKKTGTSAAMPEVAQIQGAVTDLLARIVERRSHGGRPWWRGGGWMNGGRRRAVARLEEKMHALDLILRHCRDPGLCARPRHGPPGLVRPLEKVPPTVILMVGSDPVRFQFALTAHLRHTQRKSAVGVLLAERDRKPVQAILDAAAAAYPGRIVPLVPSSQESFVERLNAALLWARGDVCFCDDTVRPSTRWLQKMRDSAHASADNACVMPVSGMIPRGDWAGHGAFSEALGYDDLETIWSAATSPLPMPLPDWQRPDLRCLYIRRDALASLGFFDPQQAESGGAAVAGFARRATRAGWRLAWCSSCFVVPMAADGGAGADAVAESRTRTREKAAQPAGIDPVESLYGRLQEQTTRRLKAITEAKSELAADPRPGILYIVFKGGGGTPQTSQDLASQMARRCRCHLLEADSDQWHLWRVNEPGQGNTLMQRVRFSTITEWSIPSDPDRAGALRRLVGEYRIGLVHLRHFLNLPPELVVELRLAGLPVVVSLHDFHSLCPSAHLIDASGGFCGGDCRRHFPAPDTEPDCRAVSLNGMEVSVERLRGQGAIRWRNRVAACLNHADALVTTAPFAAELLQKNLPDLKQPIQVIEHGRDLTWHPPDQPSGWPPEELRLAVAGHITEVKGGLLIKHLGRLVHKHRLPVQWHFFGDVASEDYRPAGSINHGRFSRNELPTLLRRHEPHLLLIPSVMAETYCHVLTESWSAGIPVLANDHGAQGERIRAHGGGWLVPRADPDQWLAALQSIMSDARGYRDRVAEIQAMHPRTTEAMADDYIALYQAVGWNIPDSPRHDAVGCSSPVGDRSDPQRS